MPQRGPDYQDVEHAFEVLKALGEERAALQVRLLQIEEILARFAAVTSVAPSRSQAAEVSAVSYRTKPDSIRNRTIAVMQKNPHQDFTTAALASETHANKKSLRTTLKNMVDAGEIERVRDGVFRLKHRATISPVEPLGA